MQHDTPEIAAGQVGVVAGPMLSAATRVDVIIRGVGGHGARPEATKAPVAMAAQFVLAVQTIVSRQIAPQDPAVVTVGSIHGGTWPNIIPDDVKLQISTCAFSEEVRRNTLAAIERAARRRAGGGRPGRACAHRASQPGGTVPVTYNDPALAARLKGALSAVLGSQNVLDGKTTMVSEDFGLFGLEGRQVPCVMPWLGAAAPDKLKESLRSGHALPSLRSSLFALLPEPAIRTGVIAMTWPPGLSPCISRRLALQCKVLFYDRDRVSIFDLLFIVVFLATVATLLSAAFLANRGQAARALVVLRRYCICAGAYLGIVVLTSVFWPGTVLQVGDPRCFDDWCIAVENASRQPAGGRVSYAVTLRLSSRARRVSQRENGVVVYLTDNRGRRYDPAQNQSDVPLSVQLGPQESITATRVFEVPADTHEFGLVIAHEGGFPIGWFIVGYETWFHKPAIVRLQ